jgi:maltose phosphorylase
MLVEISRFLLSRGQWNREGKFGYYCVMGPDEFQMMVHHNSYTNYLAKRTFLFTLEVRDLLKDNDKYEQIIEKLGIGEDFFRKIKTAAAQMLLLYDPETELFEQHLGYFELPHIDIGSIPVTDFPLYNNWSYDRIYRNDMIKQPDVLMFLFLFASDFPLSVKKANYEFYEPRCIHESSLSPSVHSILAAEIGKKDEALAFFEFATRLDLDDYNRNAEEGLHLTSIAAAWMNIVYGFGGLRSDGACLSLAPQIPAIWKRYAFKINYRGKNIRVEVTKDEVKLSSDDEKPATLLLYGKEIILRDEYRAELRK